MDYMRKKDEKGQPYLEIKLREENLIKSSLLNKGMAFSYQERVDFNLLGLIPPYEASLAIQRERSYQAFKSKPTDLDKYIYLRDLQDSNETLFYSLLTHHMEEMLPIVYTPTVGLGCQRFSYIYRRPRGLFIAYPYREHIDKILSSPKLDKVKLIVVTDGERILGLGDQGAGGMGISIGKLALYTACAGIYPAFTLPILLDTGTNNEALRNDPLYIGWRHERVRGAEYNAMIDAFVSAVKRRFKHVLLHWEDFAQNNAGPILSRYRDELCTFNDDIQGTAAVATGTLFAAMRLTGQPLSHQRIIVVGAGSAGCGISNLLVKAMVAEGLTQEEAYRHFYLIDRDGLLFNDTPNLLDFQRPFARDPNEMHCYATGGCGLLEVVKQVKPTVLIGVCGQAGIFNEVVVRAMAANTERPIIFPLSNPTAKAEATPEDLVKWTDGRVLFGTGSPFAPVTINGKTRHVDQVNNSYIFPGIGLGVIAAKAERITDNMFMAAAKALASQSPSCQDKEANLLPPLSDIRAITLAVAVEVAKEAIHANLAHQTFADEAELKQHIASYMWKPEYVPYRHVDH